MTNQINVTYYGTTEPPWLNSIESVIKADTQVVYNRKLSIEQIEAGIAIIRFETKDNAAVILTKMTEASRLLKSGQLKIYISCKVEHPKLIELFMKKGASDLVQDQTAPRTVLHKIKRSTALLLSELSRNQAAETRKDLELSKTTDVKEAERPRVDWIAAEPCDGDFWIVDQPKQVRFITSKWTLEILGPAPSCGKWEKQNQEHNHWVWTLREKASAELRSKAGETWNFVGKEPVFAWDKNRWIFTSEKPEFYLLQSTGKKVFRVEPGEGKKLRIWKATDRALALRPLIESTFYTEIHIHERREKVKKMQIDLSKDPLSKEFDYQEKKDSDEREWNSNIGEDPETKDWRKGDLGKREAIEGGGGLAQGQGGSQNKGYGYDVDVGFGRSLSIPQGDDAFVSLKLFCFLSVNKEEPDIKCDILDITQQGVYISLNQKIELSEPLVLRAILKKTNNETVSKLSFTGSILAQTWDEGILLIHVGLDSMTKNKLEGMLSELSARQDQVKDFLKKATGR